MGTRRSTASDERALSEVRDGMRIDWDFPLEMDDGTVLRADVFRPAEPGRYPVIMSYGPYGKWLRFEDLYIDQWRRMCEDHPHIAMGSSNRYQNWEVADPERWVPDGYAVVRVDSRGAGRSPGVLDLWSRREAEDYRACIQWAGVQSWSNGKVGLNGISYFAMNQWQVAALQPKHLAAICVWEGAADYYRDMVFHGGIYCPSREVWFRSQILRVQHGKGTNGLRSSMTGGWVSGPKTLTDEELGANRRNFVTEFAASRFATDAFWTSRMPDWSKITVPLLSAANWGGHGLHPRGNFEGFMRAASEQKWLEVHGMEHWTSFYTDYGVDLQKRFFGHFLKGEDTGWLDEPKVRLQVRHPDEVFVERQESSWPLAQTQWTPFHLDFAEMTLKCETPACDASVTYGGLSEGITLLTLPFSETTEITGPIAAKLFVSSATADADLFLIVRVFSPDLREVTFAGAVDPHTPIAQGWLRASRRKLDPELSLPYRPYHTHDEDQPLEPGEIYELDVEIWPTSIVVPEAYRIALTIRGRDYEWPGGLVKGLGTHASVFTGVGPFKHADAKDRPISVFGADVTLHCDAERRPYLLLPIIPPR